MLNEQSLLLSDLISYLNSPTWPNFSSSHPQPSSDSI